MRHVTCGENSDSDMRRWRLFQIPTCDINPHPPPIHTPRMLGGEEGGWCYREVMVDGGRGWLEWSLLPHSEN